MTLSMEEVKELRRLSKNKSARVRSRKSSVGAQKSVKPKPKKAKPVRVELKAIRGFAEYLLKGDQVVSVLSGKQRILSGRDVFVLLGNDGERHRLTLEQIKQLAMD